MVHVGCGEAVQNVCKQFSHFSNVRQLNLKHLGKFGEWMLLT